MAHLDRPRAARGGGAALRLRPPAGSLPQAAPGALLVSGPDAARGAFLRQRNARSASRSSLLLFFVLLFVEPTFALLVGFPIFGS